MAFYTRAFGDCAGCEAVFPGPSSPSAPPASTFGPPASTPGTALGPPSEAIWAPPCVGPASRWWLWLAIGFGIGYLVND